jgi:D-alanyl-lipoteichoic acid acyltransferase DltB (MBOAT superfamily)
MLTMLIGGLWHGASWTFVVWGGLHGAYLIGERVFERVFSNAAWRSAAAARFAGAVVTFTLVCIAWVFFRATSFSQAFAILSAMGLGNGDHVLDPGNYPLVIGTMIAILSISWILRERSLAELVERIPWPVRSAALAAMMLALILMQGQDRAFIYFQF